MKNGINVGDRVEIRIPVGDIIVATRMDDNVTPAIAMKFNGHRGIVTRAKAMNRDHKIYEVYGAVSEAGIPFTFVRKWLQVVESHS